MSRGMGTIARSCIGSWRTALPRIPGTTHHNHLACRLHVGPPFSVLEIPFKPLRFFPWEMALRGICRVHWTTLGTLRI